MTTTAEIIEKFDIPRQTAVICAQILGADKNDKNEYDLDESVYSDFVNKVCDALQLKELTLLNDDITISNDTYINQELTLSCLAFLLSSSVKHNTNPTLILCRGFALIELINEHNTKVTQSNPHK